MSFIGNTSSAIFHSVILAVFLFPLVYADNEALGQEFNLKIVHGETEAPVPEVDLKIWMKGAGQEADEYVDKTDIDGICRLDPPEKLEHLRIKISGGGFVPLEYYWHYNKQLPDRKYPPENYTINLSKGVIVGGTICDEAGIPLPNMEVQGNIYSNAQNIWDGESQVSEIKTTTDAAGKWSMQILPGQSDTLSLSVKNINYMDYWLQVRLQADPDEKDALLKNNFKITLKPVAELKGKVVDAEGRPLTGALVMVDSSDNTISIDAKGHFSTKIYTENGITLVVRKEGYAFGIKKIPFESLNAGTVVIELEKAFEFSGKIVDKNGKPLEGVKISVRENCYAMVFKEGFNSVTNADGIFRFNQLPMGNLAFEIKKNGFLSHEWYPINTADKNIKITLYPVIRVSGAVSDAETREPLVKFKMRSSFFNRYGEFKEQQGPGFSAEVNQIDQYAIKPELDCEIEIAADGYKPEKKSLKVKLGEINYKLDFELKKMQGVQGVVKLIDGSPAKNAQIVIPDEYGIRRDEQREINKNIAGTDDAGAFTFFPTTETDDKTPVIVYSKDGFYETDMKSLSGKDLVLSPWGSMTVRLSTNLSNLEENKEIVLKRFIFHHGKYFSFYEIYEESVKAEKDGNFILERVPGGYYVISINAGPTALWQYGYIKPGENLKVELGKSSNELKASISIPAEVTEKIKGKLEYDLDADQSIPDEPDERQVKDLAEKGHEMLLSHGDAGKELRITGIPPGKYRLSFSFRTESMTNGLSANSKDLIYVAGVPKKMDLGVLDFSESGYFKELLLQAKVERNKNISGKVVDEEGKPVFGVALENFSAKDAGDFKEYKAFTDENGRFNVKNLPNLEKISCELVPPGDTYMKYYHCPVDGQDIEIKLKKVAFLSGTVKDAATGKIVPSEQYRLYHESCGDIYDKNAEGGYLKKFDAITWGDENRMLKEHEITLTSPIYYPVKKKVSVEFGKTKTLDFSLETGKLINGKVVNPDRTPSADSMIILCRKLIGDESTRIPLLLDDFIIDSGRLHGFNIGSYSVVAKSAKDGSYSILPFRDGRFAAVILSDEGFAVLSEDEFRKAAEIKLQKWASLKVKVDLKDKEEISLYLRNINSGFERCFSYGPENEEADTGTYAFTHVMACYYELNVKSVDKNGDATTSACLFGKLAPGETREILVNSEFKGGEYSLKGAFEELKRGKTDDGKRTFSVSLVLLLPEDLPAGKNLPENWEKMSEDERIGWFVSLNSTEKGVEILSANPYIMEYEVSYDESDYKQNICTFKNLIPGIYGLKIYFRDNDRLENEVILKRFTVKDGKDKTLDVGRIEYSLP
ncbi:MAG TPA: hypothetical protein DCZ94_02420 [Lentisphaeria bacterium]|nr:MAG: hypothetical protein A2X48_16130 [Lentisphaerae bacterium GWF2_49_21]HBC85789.1 hypothetical protein [Lentisphaeria bacterium]